MTKQKRMMDDRTFQELLDANEIDLILMDGGDNLTKKQMDKVREKAGKISEERLKRKKQKQAEEPGYKESQLMPVIQKLLESSGGQNKQQTPVVPPVIQPSLGRTKKKPQADSRKESASLEKRVGQQQTAEPVKEKKGFFEKLLGLFTKKEEDFTLESPSEKILGGIYKKLVEAEDIRKGEESRQQKLAYQQFEEEERKHQEILKALTLRRPKNMKVKKEKKEKETPSVKKETPQVSPKSTPKVAPKATPRTTPKTQTKVAPKATPVAPPIAASTGVAATTAVKVAGTGLLAAASMSVRGETGGDLNKVSTDAKKVGQVVQNDPKPGVSSYGIFGINSGGSVQKFILDNPQFQLEGKPGTSEFDESWKKVAKERTKEFYDAQINWYSKYVYEPTKRDMQKLLPGNISSNDKVITYMTDRRNQMGKLYEQEAINYASGASSPEEFISKIAEHDANDAFIRKAFPTYLKNNGMDKIKGLQNRVEMRKQMSLSVAQTGGNIQSSSQTNNEMRRNLQTENAQTNAQQNVSVQKGGTKSAAQKQDDRSAYERKVNGE